MHWTFQHIADFLPTAVPSRHTGELSDIPLSDRTNGKRTVSHFRDVMPGLADAEVRQLATYAMAGADGLFIAKEIGGDIIDLAAPFELHGRAIYETARRLSKG